MKIAVCAHDSIFFALTESRKHIDWIRIDDASELNSSSQLDACFMLVENAAEQDYQHLSCPVFINSVAITLQEKKHGPNVFRINAWPGFVERTIWEVAGNVNQEIQLLFNTIGIKAIAVPDQPGLVAARVIAMIINEAYFAKMEQVSTADEIDIAMKLGTNYPKGPFEWKNTIGIRNIHQLLFILSLQDTRYTPCPLLTQEAEA